MPKDAAQKKQDAVQNINKLTLAFAKAAAHHQEDKSDNLVVSPYNALTCLSMVAEGAANNTQQEMAQALFGADKKSLSDDVQALADFNTELLAAQQGQVELKTANGVWVNKEQLALNQKFAARLKKVFGAEISEESFSDPSVPGKINAWAGANTNQLITKIVEKLKKEDFAVLASALYFKGQWTDKFDKKETKELLFKGDGGAASVTPTMHQYYKEGKVTYQQGADYEAVALTYGKEDFKERKSPTMRLVLVRPTDKAVSARDWLAKQADAGNTAWMEGRFARAQGTVELPRLDIKQQHDLIPVLQNLGIRDAFTEGAADFSPMTKVGSTELLISKVTHDVVFKTDEEGSEAAAVTTVSMIRATSVHMPPPTINVKFDRSFVFALQDIKTGAVLFVGAVNKPNKDMKPMTKPVKGPKPVAKKKR